MKRQNLSAAMRGVTLIEMMVVVTIITIMATVAFASYERYIVRAKRSVGQNVLVQVADRQQQFFMDNKRYAADLTNLGFSADPYLVDDDGTSTVAGDPDAVYSVSLSNVTVTSYTATAAPLGGQLSRDTSCGSLSITQAGAKSNSAGGNSCW